MYLTMPFSVSNSCRDDRQTLINFHPVTKFLKSVASMYRVQKPNIDEPRSCFLSLFHRSEIKNKTDFSACTLNKNCFQIYSKAKTFAVAVARQLQILPRYT